MDDIAVVREIYDRFSADDEEGLFELIDPEIEVHDRPEIPDPQVYRGHQGVIDAIDVSRAEFDEADVVPEEFIDAGDGAVVVVLHFVGRGRESGIPIDELLCHVWRVRDGKGVRLQVYGDRDEALRSAGALRSSAGGSFTCSASGWTVTDIHGHSGRDDNASCSAVASSASQRPQFAQRPGTRQRRFIMPCLASS